MNGIVHTIVESKSRQLDWVDIINESDVLHRNNSGIQNTSGCDRLSNWLSVAFVIESRSACLLAYLRTVF